MSNARERNYIMSIKRVQEKYSLSNPNDFVEKSITIAQSSQTELLGSVPVDLSAVQSPLSHQRGNLPS